MKYIFINLSFIIFFTYSATASTVATEDEPEDQNLAKYVSINIEIKELKESGDILKDATASLSLALKDASQNLDDLSPEQLVLINTLADKIENITDKLNLAMTNIPNTIKQAKKPTSELLNQSLEQIKDATITPIVSKLETWLIVTMIGLVVLAIALFVACAYCMKQIGNLGSTFKDIADGYRIIPIEQYRKEIREQESIEE
jgi:hypothetical protein